jgi:hypothetical protein
MSAQTVGFSGASQQGFATLEAAQDAWDHAHANHTVGLPPSSSQKVTYVSPLPANGIQTVPPCPISTILCNLGPDFTLSVWHAQNTSLLEYCSSLQIQVQQSPTPGQEMPAMPPHSGDFQPLLTVPRTPTRHLVIMTRHSPAVPHLVLSDEDAFWVVASGTNPGIYQGKYVNSHYNFFPVLK